MTDSETSRAGLTVYTTPWCGPCARLKRRLTDRGVAFEEVDVEQHPDAGRWIAALNHGARTVPTVRFADGGVLVNPTVDAVLTRLEAGAQGG